MFVFTLRFLSPKAYDYIRKKFKNNLPHQATIRKWFLNSSIDGEPGICGRSIELLKILIANQKEKGEELYCSLIHDEISIRRGAQWLHSQKKFIGFINYGSVDVDAEHLPLASNVLVFMINGMNVSFNLPIAFYFISSLNGIEKMTLITAILKILGETGVKMLAINFDGFANNIVACEMFGASFDFDHFRPNFKNPYDMSDLHIFLDPPHMVKLVRNALFKYSTMYDRDGRQIQWKHFESLVEFGENNDFVSHKMTKKHLDVERCKMNVSVAAQTLSASVASSMKSLKKRGHTDFQECDGTIELAERVDKLFDILNSDVLRSNNVYKSPIMASTRKKIFDFLDDTVDYIKKLKFQPDGHYVVDSIRKVGFKGLIIDIASLKSLYCDLVETGKLVSLPVRKINQDPLESLFGRCRSYSVLGNNTNPTVQQFSAAFRKILVNNEITSPAFSNCDDSLDLLYVSSFRDKKMQQIAQIEHFECETNVENEPNAEDETIARDELDHALYDDQYMNDNVDYGITHTAGIIEKKIASFADFKCDLGCQNIFTENNKIAKKYFTKNKNSQRAPMKFVQLHTKRFNQS